MDSGFNRASTAQLQLQSALGTAGYLNSNGCLASVVLSAGIHRLRQMVLYVERLRVSGPAGPVSIAYRSGSVRRRLLLNERDSFNLNHRITRQARHLNCRPRRRILFEVSAIDLIHLTEIVHVGEEHSRL